MGKDFAFYEILIHLRIFRVDSDGMLVISNKLNKPKNYSEVFARGKFKPEAYCVYMIFDILRSDPFVNQFFDKIPMSVQKTLHEHVD